MCLDPSRRPRIGDAMGTTRRPDRYPLNPRNYLAVTANSEEIPCNQYENGSFPLLWGRFQPYTVEVDGLSPKATNSGNWDLSSARGARQIPFVYLGSVADLVCLEDPSLGSTGRYSVHQPPCAKALLHAVWVSHLRRVRQQRLQLAIEDVGDVDVVV